MGTPFHCPEYVAAFAQMPEHFSGEYCWFLSRLSSALDEMFRSRDGVHGL
jgi:hypothetical protein